MSLTFPIVNHIFFLRSICLCSYSNLSLILVVVCSDRVFIHLLFKRYLLNLIVYVVIVYFQTCVADAVIVSAATRCSVCLTRSVAVVRMAHLRLVLTDLSTAVRAFCSLGHNSRLPSGGRKVRRQSLCLWGIIQ
jgi:hypothetical protein